MDVNKLAPWNWFKKEEEEAVKPLPVDRREASYPAPFAQMRKEFDRLFDDFTRGLNWPTLSWPREGGAEAWLKPRVDIEATDKQYAVSVELPGVDPKDVSLELVDDTLRIKGEKKRESEEKDKNYHRVERSYGSFQRVLSLPEDADRDAIEADFKKGVMKIAIPRKAVETPNARRIDVQSE